MKRSIAEGVLVVVALCVAGCGGGSADGPQPTMSGEEVYGQFCFSCHATGAAGAPKLGDTAAWAPRLAQGESLLLKATIAGIAPGMPPRGLCGRCTDADLAAAIEYITEQSRE